MFSLLQFGQQTIRLAGTCLGLWLAGRAAVYGTRGGGGGDGDGGDVLSPGSFVIVQLYIQQLFQPLSFLGYTYRQLTEALTDLEKAVAMLRSTPVVLDAKDAVPWDVALQRNIPGRERNGDGAAAGGDVTFDNVSFRYKVPARRKQPGVAEGRDAAGGGRGRRGGRGFRGRGGRGRGRGMWSGKGQGNFWLKSAAAEEEPAGEGTVEKQEVGGIRNVSFHIPAGKTAALVGPSTCDGVYLADVVVADFIVLCLCPFA